MEQTSYSFSLSGYPALALILGILCLPIFGRYLVRYLFWRQRLRALKSRKTVITEYIAPLDIPPAFFGTIVDNRTSIQDMVATILSLIHKGILSLTYNSESNEVFIEKTVTDTNNLYSHEKYIASLFDENNLSKAELTRILSQANFEFNFLLLQDLQKAGFYLFHKDMDVLNSSEYYTKTVRGALKKGLVKPWNWPGLLLSVIFFPFGFAWLIISLVFYNRIGLYNYKTKKWEEMWPKVAGYYNYLWVVESERRNSEINSMRSDFKVSEHDPYLTAVQLQKQWQKLFMNSFEIGAGGKEYDTL